ncbi:MAG: hypothetical protein FJ006_05665 [Chloroflexi bacterium]|nr:hypothetical protein [Chloroflexota bacterium]
MTESDTVNKLEGLSYFIDLYCFQESDRSFAAIAWHCLCSACQERAVSSLKDVEAASLIASIKDCCSKAPDFINSKLPLFEWIFRVFLSRGNEPLSLAELASQLAAYFDNPVSLTPQTLKRLLDSDRYYGFKQWTRAK